MIQLVRPNTLGWIQKKLSAEEMQHLWKCIEAGGEDWKQNLAGQNHKSYIINDLDDIFYTKTLVEMCKIYTDSFGNIGDGLVLKWTPYHLSSMWVNYQNKNEFNPLHHHDGVYSFVVWMKIPTEFEDQNKTKSTKPCVSSFEFLFSDILGNHNVFQYDLGSGYEGTMLFFPAKLKHQVYPFYDTDQTRISISGNIDFDF